MAYMHRVSSDSELPEKDIKSQNRQALDLLDNWVAEPNEHDELWWQGFERYLKEHRFSIHKDETE